MLMNNLVMLKGRLGADAEIRTTNSGDRVANLRLVTVDLYKTKAASGRNGPNGTVSPSGARAPSSTWRSTGPRAR